MQISGGKHGIQQSEHVSPHATSDILSILLVLRSNSDTVGNKGAGMIITLLTRRMTMYSGPAATRLDSYFT